MGLFEPGGQIGKYLLKKQLGEGGFGMVFVARDPGLDRDVALKFLLSKHTANPELVARFLAEARAAAQINHAGIVTVYECGQIADGTAYIAMELLSGESLEDRIAKVGAMPPLVAIEITRQIAAALGAAHARNIVHRDLKPANVFMVPDRATILGERVKVLDFGIAKLGEGMSVSGVQTASMMIFGTPRYMSPEQCRSSTNVDARSDIYSLGVMLFELLTGERPFDGEPGSLIALHQVVPPPTVRSKRPEVSEGLDAFVAAMLAKQPADRPASMDEVLRRLDQLAPPAVGVQTLPLPITRPPVDPAASANTLPLGSEGTDPTVPPTSPTAPARPAAAGSSAEPIAPVAKVARTEPVVRDIPPTAAPPRASRKWIAPVAALAVVGGGAGIFLATRPGGESKPAGIDAPRAPDAAPVVDAPPAKPRIPEGMVLIPEGEFTMGSDDEEIARTFAWCKTLYKDPDRNCNEAWYKRERPVHRVKLAAFVIDRRERTIGEVIAWAKKAPDSKLEVTGTLKIGRLEVPGAWFVSRGMRVLAAVDNRPDFPANFPILKDGQLAHAGSATLPAGGVTYHGARAFCRSLGLDLPTEAQWERAARDTTGTRFPWGNELPTCERAVFATGERCKGARGALPVDREVTARGDLTREGVQDLGGNVGEWVRDRFVEQYPACTGTCVDPEVEATDGVVEPRVIRGGNFDGEAELLRSAGRLRRPPVEAGADTGFRCAMRYDQVAP